MSDRIGFIAALFSVVPLATIIGGAVAAASVQLSRLSRAKTALLTAGTTAAYLLGLVLVLVNTAYADFFTCPAR